MPIAPLITGWRRWYGGTPGVSQGSSAVGGVPFLDQVPRFAESYPNARLYVEWAPGADLTASDTTWPWQDITADVLQADGNVINISPIGRTDSDSQTSPAGCTLVLDNRSGDYSKGPQSRNYPNVRLNIPFKVSISLTGQLSTKVVRFQGYIWSMRPSWDSTGDYAVVGLQASGMIRRLQQGAVPFHSALYRDYTTDDDLVAYWPMEDQSGSTTLKSAVDGQRAMTFSGGLNLASYTGSGGSDALPAFDTTASINAYVTKTFSNHWEIYWLMYVPAAPVADTAVLRFGTAGGTIVRWEIVWDAGSTDSWSVKGYLSNGTIDVNDPGSFGSSLVGRLISCRFMVRQNGADVDYQLVRFPIDTFVGSVNGGTYPTASVGELRQISNLAAAGMDNVVIGQVGVFDTYDRTNNDDALLGWIGDAPSDRIAGLLAEEGIQHTRYGSSSIDSMGTQDPESLMTLLREAEAVDFGILGDGLSAGLYFVSRQTFTNQAVDMSLSATANEFMPDFQPEDDDQEIVNKATATRKGGTSATYADTDGPLGTAVINPYESSETFNVRYDEDIPTYAEWMVHLGTVEGYRYPRVKVNFTRIPAKAADWLRMIPSSRLLLTDVADYATQHPDGDINLFVEGWGERLSRFVWDVDLVCSSHDPWQVLTIASDSITSGSQYDEYVFRVDVDEDAVVVVTPASAGATIVFVTLNTDSGNTLAVTDSDGVSWDLPISIGGRRYTVATMFYNAGNQEIWLNEPLVADVPVGTVVKLWNPPVLGV